MRTIFVLLGLLAASVTVKAQTLTSPDGNFKMQFHLSDEGKPVYSLMYKEKEVINESKMGFQISPSIAFDRNFSIVETKIDSCATVWKTVWGQNSEIRDHHKELWVALKQEKSGRLLNIRFRLFNDGLGFRYEFPVQSSLRHFTLKEELTEFQLAGNHKAFWIPADYDTNEFQITTSRLSEVPLLIDEARNEPLACKSPTPNLAVQTPLMLKSDNGLYINIHEAALVNYPAMHLNLYEETYLMSAHLTPDKNGNKGYIQTGSVTPWRTIIVSDDARDILASNLILNLGEVLGIVGESGSGKSTLLNMLSGRMEPTSGTIAYRDAAGRERNIHALPEGEKRRLLRSELGFVHQRPSDGLRMQVSAGANIGERLMAEGARHYGTLRGRALQWLERVEIDAGRIDDKPALYSGGMQQRLQIARNLVTSPRLVFMDEPTGGLDVSVQARLLDLLRHLVLDMDLAVILVTHDLAVARLLSHRLMVMYRGEVVETGLTDQVLDDPHHAYTQLLVSSILQG